MAGDSAPSACTSRWSVTSTCKAEDGQSGQRLLKGAAARQTAPSMNSSLECNGFTQAWRLPPFSQTA